MNQKRVRKIKEMAALFYQFQPPESQVKKTVEQIYKELKQVHKKKNK